MLPEKPKEIEITSIARREEIREEKKEIYEKPKEAYEEWEEDYGEDHDYYVKEEGYDEGEEEWEEAYEKREVTYEEKRVIHEEGILVVIPFYFFSFLIFIIKALLSQTAFWGIFFFCYNNLNLYMPPSYNWHLMIRHGL